MKTHEVTIIMYVKGKSKEQAEKRVVEWLDEMTISVDNFPDGFDGCSVEQSKD